MDFDAAGLHEHDALMHVDHEVCLRPRGQLDLFLENGIHFQECLPLGLGITTWGGCLGRKTDVEAGGRKKDCDEEPSVAQLRK